MLNVKDSLEVKQFTHMTIRCNRISDTAPLSGAMQCAPATRAPLHLADKFLAWIGDTWRALLLTILVITDFLGFFWIPLVIFLTVLMALCLCCVCGHNPDWYKDVEAYFYVDDDDNEALDGVSGEPKEQENFQVQETRIQGNLSAHSFSLSPLANSGNLSSFTPVLLSPGGLQYTHGKP